MWKNENKIKGFFPMEQVTSPHGGAINKTITTKHLHKFLQKKTFVWYFCQSLYRVLALEKRSSKSWTF